MTPYLQDNNIIALFKIYTPLNQIEILSLNTVFDLLKFLVFTCHLYFKKINDKDIRNYCSAFNIYFFYINYNSITY